ncbi:hypothetical protein ACRHM7_17790 [Chromohalobacter israelensis]|uniref:hypothetical protein n=1 Tax=Chromohalobacter israelensis TaxID=141390 RepID=UPI003D7A46A2
MSRWSDKAKNHPIHETVLQARELVYKEIEDIDSEHEEEQRRLVKILDRIQDLLDGIDPDIFPEGEFNNINTHMRHQNFWNQLTAYSNSGNVQNLKTANDHINAQLPRIFSIAGMARSPEVREEVNSIESAFEEFCKVVEKKKSEVFEDVSSIDGKVKELQGSEKEIRNGFDDLRQKVSVQFDEWANEFASSQANRQNEHAESEVNRRKEFEETLIDIKSRAEDEVKDISKKHDDSLRSVFDGFSEEVKTRSEDIGNKHQSVLDIHELVATDGVAGGYKKNADDEKVSADNWRRISLGTRPRPWSSAPTRRATRPRRRARIGWWPMRAADDATGRRGDSARRHHGEALYGTGYPGTRGRHGRRGRGLSPGASRSPGGIAGPP